MKKIYIGISASHDFSTKKYFEGYEYSILDKGYTDAILQAGAIPIILPITNNMEVIKSYIDLVDGIILSGGHDVTPAIYNQEPHKLLEKTSKRRDLFEINLLSEACNKNKPVLGICRGLQLINVSFGGSLYQDLSLANEEKINHIQECKYDNVWHSVKLSSILKDVIGNEYYEVNSFHHQIIDKLAPGFEVIAIANDNTKEAIYYENENLFILATQWHPEMMLKDEGSINLFRYFVNKILERRK